MKIGPKTKMRIRRAVATNLISVRRVSTTRSVKGQLIEPPKAHWTFCDVWTWTPSGCFKCLERSIRACADRRTFVSEMHSNACGASATIAFGPTMWVPHMQHMPSEVPLSCPISSLICSGALLKSNTSDDCQFWRLRNERARDASFKARRPGKAMNDAIPRRQECPGFTHFLTHPLLPQS